VDGSATRAGIIVIIIIIVYIFGLNILCIIQVTVSAWTLGVELKAYVDYNLRLRKTSPVIFFLFR